MNKLRLMLVSIFNKCSANSENLKLVLAVSNMNQPKTDISQIEPTKKLGAAKMYTPLTNCIRCEQNHIAVSYYCPQTNKKHSRYPFI